MYTYQHIIYYHTTITYCKIDLDPCGHTAPCENGATCSNTGPDQYECLCTAGFEGDSCERETDECDPNPCRNGGSCQVSVMHTVGSTAASHQSVLQAEVLSIHRIYWQTTCASVWIVSVEEIVEIKVGNSLNAWGGKDITNFTVISGSPGSGSGLGAVTGGAVAAVLLLVVIVVLIVILVAVLRRKRAATHTTVAGKWQFAAVAVHASYSRI